MNDRRSTCGNCIWHSSCPMWGQGVCDNPASIYYEYYTADSAYCKQFEMKEDEREDDGSEMQDMP